MCSASNRDRPRAGFTLMELMTVVVIIGILAAMVLPAISYMRVRAERVACLSNLKTLYVGANTYVQEQGQWPQIRAKAGSPEYVLGWVGALDRYSVTHKNWICPGVQRNLKNPDYRQQKTLRIDYFATPFDDKPRSAFKWMTQPWFAERANMHGDGQLVIFANGEIKSLAEVLKTAAPSRTMEY